MKTTKDIVIGDFIFLTNGYATPIKVKTKKKHLNSGANWKKYINIGQYVFKSYQFKMLNFTKCYAVFCL